MSLQMHHNAPAVHLRQIAYSPATLAAIEPGYTLLDNCRNPRPDWFEIWPIRAFLLHSTLDDTAFYGFFSPKFGAKTGLSHADVTGFVQQHAAQADVMLFSPQPDMGAFYLNVFEQGETFDPGLMAAFEAFLHAVGRPASLASLVMDARQVVFSNYFVARPAFWREWLALTDAFFGICEGPDTPLRRQLVQPTSYPGQVQRKVFLAERIASLLLATQTQWRTRAADPFAFAWSMTRMRDYPTEAVISDALKVAYREHGWAEYLRAFAALRERCFVANAPTLTHREPHTTAGARP